MSDSRDIASRAVDYIGTAGVYEVAATLERHIYAFGAPKDGMAGIAEASLNAAYLKLLGIELTGLYHRHVELEEDRLHAEKPINEVFMSETKMRGAYGSKYKMGKAKGPKYGKRRKEANSAYI